MSAKLKVQILKKSKDAKYPEHIVVERPGTHEIAHLFFDEGTLVKGTHLIRSSNIKMGWDDKVKQYKPLKSTYDIATEFSIENGKSSYLKRSQKTKNFFCFYARPLHNILDLCFLHPQQEALFPLFFIRMDLQGKCKPSNYIKTYEVVEIEEVHPDREGKTCQTLKTIKQNVRE